MSCRLIQSDGVEPCDCTPADDSKAMPHDDVMRVFFAPLPPEECGFIDYMDWSETGEIHHICRENPMADCPRFGKMPSGCKLV